MARALGRPDAAAVDGLEARRAGLEHEMSTADTPILNPTPASAASGAPDAAQRARIDAACAQACAAVAPAWPLDQSIAVNPHWQRIGRPLREVAARMALLAGIRVFPARDELLRAWERGRVGAQDLQAALALLPQAAPAGWNAARCVEALRMPPALPRLPLLIDLLDDDARRHARLPWRDAVTHQISQTCAAYFDRQQADWQPARGQGLYAFWRDTIGHDHGIALLMGLPGLPGGLHALPPTREDAETWALGRLGLPEAVWADYLEAVLLSLQGWASWCAYLGWQAGLEGRADSHLRELLAIRLAWGVILLECRTGESARQAFAEVQASWAQAPAALARAGDELLPDEIWQLALDLGYQRELLSRLGSAPVPEPRPAEAQAVFCIDVRSEPLRRALESVWPAVRTHGFAGFFGLPAAYTPLGTTARRPQLPGLLAPAVELGEVVAPAPGARAATAAELEHAALAARGRKLAAARQRDGASRWPAAAFSYVESAGFTYLGALGRWLVPAARPRVNDDLAGISARYRPVCRPRLLGLDAQARTDLAARVLRAMGLLGDFAPLVLLVGHASQSANNAHAAALDCGACCGNSGETNARALAHLLNEAGVREGLRPLGIGIPEATVFVAALHNTTTDELEAFDLDLLPDHARPAWERMRTALEHACDQVRRERAPRLGLDARAAHAQLLQDLRKRANDGAQTRPEWGLAGNAALILAPRERSRGARLDGRCFLHDYDAAGDPDGSLLEALMTAPMLVAHWINWQYHASTCDPEHLGSGNKLLHNVVGGNIGVFEGNGGDLRIGLSRQSLHDGQHWMHEPLRLSVLIEAAQDAIEAALRRHARLRELADNGWLHLLRMDGRGGVWRRESGGAWSPAGAAAAGDGA
ncbi:MAG: DUF2309 domain-containing protein [Betaproteobacteria bacterium]|nr:DUF2309 domain-containing protein [Betaproteobacteria bacterium]